MAKIFNNIKVIFLYILANVLILVLLAFMCLGAFLGIREIANSIATHNGNTTDEIHTVTCEVIDKYESTDSVFDTAGWLLMDITRYKEVTTYVIVVEYEGNLYDVEVEEATYNEISIGDMPKCEVVSESNEVKNKHSYKISILEE